MSGTVTINGSIRVANGTFTDSFSTGVQNITQTNQGVGGGVQTIATSSSGTAISTGSVATLGWAYAQNLDATNYLDLCLNPSSSVANPFARLKPGEAALLRLTPAVSYFGRAHTASCLLNLRVWED